MDTETAIERFIVDEIMLGDSSTKIDPNESLISTGVLDSLALLRLIAFIEEQFGVIVGDAEVIPENFETINEIKEFIEQKKS
jgi:acyl carrier protein